MRKGNKIMLWCSVKNKRVREAEQMLNCGSGEDSIQCGRKMEFAKCTGAH